MRSGASVAHDRDTARHVVVLLRYRTETRLRPESDPSNTSRVAGPPVTAEASPTAACMRVEAGSELDDVAVGVGDVRVRRTGRVLASLE